MDSLYIEDGYTAAKTVAAVPGLYPELRILYRPALSIERQKYRRKLELADAEAADKHELELIRSYTVSINGEDDKSKLAKLKPGIRAIVVDLILGYSPADEAADAKN